MQALRVATVLTVAALLGGGLGAGGAVAADSPPGQPNVVTDGELDGWVACDTECPSAPQITSISATVDTLAVAWSWGADAPPADVTDVLVRVAPGDYEVVSEPADLLATLNGLTPDTEYTVTLYAAAGQQLSAPSDAAITRTLLNERTGSDVVDDALAKPQATPGNVDRLIVTLKNEAAPEQQAVAVSSDLPVAGVAVEGAQDLGAGNVLVELSDGVSDADAALVIEDLEQDSRVESVVLDTRVQRTTFPDTPPNDTDWATQWGLNGNYGVRVATNTSTMGTAWASGMADDVVVAILDTGYTSHPDLNGQLVAGYDFVGSNPAPTCRTGATNGDGDYIDTGTYGAIGWDSNPKDPGDWTTVTSLACGTASTSSWHGTHVSGIVAADTNNATGVAGVAPHAKLQPVRVLSFDGGYTSDIVAAITWASGGSVDGVPANPTPADVINMSLGGLGSCDSPWQTAINSAVARGTAVVVAAGNETANASAYVPASCSNVITVAATDSAGDRASFSNYGSTVEVAAPGVTIRSTWNDGTTTVGSPDYRDFSGTSMATPHVSGIAALISLTYPNLTPAQMLTRIQSGVTSFPGGSTCTTSICGSGIANATASVTAGPVPVAALPTSGTTAGGDDVTITGYNLTGASATFGGTSAPGVSVTSKYEVVATTPAHAAGTVDVGVTTVAGTRSLASAFTFVAPPPSGGGGSSGSSSPSTETSSGGGGLNEITRIVPADSGAPGSVIALAGWGLSTTREVLFNDYPAASWQVITDSHVEVTVPNIPAGVYVIHAVLAPDVGRASYWPGFHVLPAAVGTATPQPPGTTTPAFSTIAELITFAAKSARLSTSTKAKLTRIATKVEGSVTTGTITSFTDAKGSAASKKVARARARALVAYLKAQGVEGTFATRLQRGTTPTLRKGAVVQLSNDPAAAAVTAQDQVRSLIVRYAKGVSPSVKGTVRGASLVTGGLGAGMTLGPNLGLRMYRVDFAKPVTLAQAQLAATQMSKAKGVEFAEPDRIVTAQVSRTQRAR